METLKIGRKSGVSSIELKSYTDVMGPIRNIKSAWELIFIFCPTLMGIPELILNFGNQEITASGFLRRFLFLLRSLRKTLGELSILLFLDPSGKA